MAATSRSVDIRAAELADDDPFAELTRIMGHDPRPVSQDPEPALPVELTEDDLSIDLENELLTGMSDFDTVETSAAEPASAAMQHGHEVPGGDLPGDIDDDLVAAFEAEFEDEPGGPQPASAPGHGSVSGASSASVRDREIDPVFDTFNVGDNAHSFFENEDRTREAAFIVTGLATPIPAALATRMGVSLSAVRLGHGFNSGGRTAAAAPAAGEAMERELEIPAAADEVGRNDAGGDLGVSATDHSGPAELSHAPAFDPLDLQDASDFEKAMPRGDAETESEESLAFDYRRAASDRHEFLEEALAGETRATNRAGNDGWRAAGRAGTAGALFESHREDVVSGADEDAAQDDHDAVPDAAPASTLLARPDDGRGGNDAPLVETVEISDKPAAPVDDLNIPDPEPIPEGPHGGLAFDDLAEELAGAFGAMEDETDNRSGNSYASPAADALENAVLDEQMAAAAEADLDGDPALNTVSAEFDPEINQDFGTWSAGDGEEEDFVDEDDTRAAPLVGYEGRKSRASRRGVIVAALLAGVAVIGGAGVFAFSAGEIGGGKPALVKADNEPFKVKPKNAGNGDNELAQNNEVYQRASGVRPAGQPEQTKLVTTTEEPIDLTQQIAPRIVDESAQAPEGDATIAKTEDRLSAEPNRTEASASEPPPIAVQPHRVKTFVVKPDGTLVPREEASAKTTNEASASDAMMSDTAGDGGLSDDPVTGATGADTEIGAAAPSTSDAEAATAVPAPIARPAEGPKVASTEVTSKPARKALAPAASAAPSGPLSDWSVQISSQPSVESAQQSYRNMASRYSDVLQGRGVNIVKADIAGKGTYYRVRIPTTSKDDAISLCSKLKSSGGNCFVSK